jgi:hypothetical protein
MQKKTSKKTQNNRKDASPIRHNESERGGHRNHWHPPANQQRVPLSQRAKAHAEAHPNDTSNSRGEEE